MTNETQKPAEPANQPALPPQQNQGDGKDKAGGPQK